LPPSENEEIHIEPLRSGSINFGHVQLLEGPIKPLYRMNDKSAAAAAAKIELIERKKRERERERGRKKER
jgi:hypothetical protein